MTYNIDLKELSARESEQVEWKENGDDKNITDGIVKTVCAFANDFANFGGGYVVCGAKEAKDEYGFPKVIYTGLTADKLKEIEGKTLQHCRDYVSPPVAPLVQELKNPDDGQTRILVFIVIADGKAHTFRDGEKTAYYIRIGRETREARNGFLTQLLASKHEIVPFDRRPNPNTGETDIDLLLFRDCMNEMKLNQPAKPLENYLSSTEQIAEFIPPLLAKKNLDDAYCLRNFTLLLFGKKNSITVNFPEAYTVISIYNGTDRSEPTAVRHTLTGSIIVQAKKSLELLKSQIYTVIDKTSATPNQEKYPARALQEALVNAVVHRDYEMPDPVRVTVFSDRIEILSPGCLHFGVDKDKFLAGKAAPNFRAMKEEGCPAPVFELGVDSVTCVLPAHPRSQA